MIMNFYLSILISFSLLVQRKGRKERTPHEKPFSSFASYFAVNTGTKVSGIAELTGIRLLPELKFLPARTCCTSFPKNSCSFGTFQRVPETS